MGCLARVVGVLVCGGVRVRVRRGGRLGFGVGGGRGAFGRDGSRWDGVRRGGLV